VRAGERGVLRAWLEMLMPVQKILLGVSAVLLAGCIWLVATWRDAVSEARASLSPPPVAPEIAEENVPETPFAYDVIVENDLFTSSRRPPERPWSETLASETADGEAASAEPAGPPPWQQYQLQGTVLTGSTETTVALIETDPASPGPERYRVGDRVGVYRLRRILPTRVILSGGIELDMEADSLPSAVATPEGR
jgi:hypothetical protein